MDMISTFWTLNGVEYYEYNDGIFTVFTLNDDMPGDDKSSDDSHHWLLLDDHKDKYTAGGADDTEENLER